jgi:hypothetical protein
VAKSVPLQLGPEFFSKKGDVEVRIRAMINSYPLMAFLAGQDEQLVSSLLAYHPAWDAKRGPGVKAIQIRPDQYGKRYFHLHRTDGTDEDISWRWCLRSAAGN